MVYRKYGEGFHELRIQHNLSLSAFEELGIAKSTLSNFENGKSMIGFDKLDMALQKMNISLFDYSLIINNGAADEAIALFTKIEQAYFQNNIKQLQEVYNEIRDEEGTLKLVAYSAKALYTNLNPQEKQAVEDYLKGVQFWGFFELYLFTNALTQIDFSLALRFLDDLWEIRNFITVQGGRRHTLVIHAVFKAILILIDNKNKEKAADMLERAKETLTPTDIWNKAIINFAESYFIYTFTNKEQGRKKMRRVIQALNVIEAKEMRAALIRQYNKRIPR